MSIYMRLYNNTYVDHENKEREKERERERMNN